MQIVSGGAAGRVALCSLIDFQKLFLANILARLLSWLRLWLWLLLFIQAVAEQKFKLVYLWLHSCFFLLLLFRVIFVAFFT